MFETASSQHLDRTDLGRRHLSRENDVPARKRGFRGLHSVEAGQASEFTSHFSAHRVTHTFVSVVGDEACQGDSACEFAGADGYAQIGTRSCHGEKCEFDDTLLRRLL